MVFEIQTLGLALDRIERDHQQSVDPLVITRCLTMCREGTERIRTIADELDLVIQKRRLLGSIKTAIKQRKWEELFTKLERAKSSLTLAFQLYTEYIDKLLFCRFHFTEHPDVVADLQEPEITSLTTRCSLRTGRCWNCKSRHSLAYIRLWDIYLNKWHLLCKARSRNTLIAPLLTATGRAPALSLLKVRSRKRTTMLWWRSATSNFAAVGNFVFGSRDTSGRWRRCRHRMAGTSDCGRGISDKMTLISSGFARGVISPVQRS